MKISFNILNGQSAKEKQATLVAIEKVIKSGSYILGPEVRSFEVAFAKYIGTKHTIGVANGLEALQISLMALGIGHGDEVITTSLSAVATTLAIKAVGAKIIFTDIDEYYHIDATKIEDKITSKTKAIIPVHLYGQSVDIDSITKIAKKHGIKIIEDCAQAHGTIYNHKKVGSIGNLGCFSFYPTKNLGGIGDGGLIATNDDKLAEKCRMIRNYGQTNRYEHAIYGINSRLDEIQATILSLRLKHLDQNNERRVKIANIYKKELGSLKEIKLPKTRDWSNHIYHLFVIQAEKRDDLQKYLKENGIDTLIHYPIPIHKQKCFLEHNSLHLPVVEKATSEIISLPMHPYLKSNEVKYICQKIKSFYRQ